MACVADEGAFSGGTSRDSSECSAIGSRAGRLRDIGNSPSGSASNEACRAGCVVGVCCGAVSCTGCGVRLSAENGEPKEENTLRKRPVAVGFSEAGVVNCVSEVFWVFDVFAGVSGTGASSFCGRVVLGFAGEVPLPAKMGLSSGDCAACCAGTSADELAGLSSDCASIWALVALIRSRKKWSRRLGFSWDLRTAWSRSCARYWFRDSSSSMRRWRS